MIFKWWHALHQIDIHVRRWYIFIQLPYSHVRGDTMTTVTKVGIWLSLPVLSVLLLYLGLTMVSRTPKPTLSILPPTPVEEACVEGVFMVWNPDWGGFVVLGDTQICGVSLRFSDIHGPSKLPDPIEKLMEKAQP